MAVSPVRSEPSDVAMDWPLSRDEKRTNLLRLYDKEVCAADTTVEALRLELSTLRGCGSADSEKAYEKLGSAANLDDDGRLSGPSVAEGAAAVLRAMLKAQASEEREGDCEEVLSPDLLQRFQRLQRARSGGALIKHSAPTKPALSRTPRSSGVGTPRRRVSFSDRPSSDSEDGCASRQSIPSSDSSDRPSLDSSEPEPEMPQSRDGSSTVRVVELCAVIGTAPVGLSVAVDANADDFVQEVRITKVTEDSWADVQRLRAGDILVAVGGKRVIGMRKADFRKRMSARPLRLSLALRIGS